MIPALNNAKWYKQMVRLNIDRMSLLELTRILNLVSRGHGFNDSTKEMCVKMGRTFALSLLKDGLVIPEEVARSWEETFNIPYTVDPGRIIPELTDQEGRPWK